MENKVIVSLRAFEARMRRHYAKQEITLCKRRGKEAERKGEYFGVHSNLISFDADVHTMVSHAREDGLLKPYEAVQVTPYCCI